MDMQILPGFNQCNSVFVPIILRWLITRDPKDYIAMQRAQFVRQTFENVCLVTIFWLPAILISSMYFYVFLGLRKITRGPLGEDRSYRFVL